MPIKTISKEVILKLIGHLEEYSVLPVNWGGYTVDQIREKISQIPRTKWLPNDVYNLNAVESWITTLAGTGPSLNRKKLAQSICLQYLYDRVRDEAVLEVRAMTSLITQYA